MSSAALQIFRDVAAAAAVESGKLRVAINSRAVSGKPAFAVLMARHRRLVDAADVIGRMLGIVNRASGSAVDAPRAVVAVAIGAIWMAMDDGPVRTAANAAVITAIDYVRLNDTCSVCGSCGCCYEVDRKFNRAVAAIGGVAATDPECSVY